MSDQFTQLNTRKLWFDGESSVEPHNFLALTRTEPSSAKFVFVDYLSDEIKKFNALSDDASQIDVKHNAKRAPIHWSIPEPYDSLNLSTYLTKRLQIDVEQFEHEEEKRIERYVMEFKRYNEYNLTPLLRTIIYVIEQFEQNNVVWGVGRGSSVSSYILYLIGVHDIDSVAYDLDFNDFLPPKTNTKYQANKET